MASVAALYDDGTARKVATPFSPSLPLCVGGLTKPIKYVPVRVGEIAAVPLFNSPSPKQLPIPGINSMIL